MKIGIVLSGGSLNGIFSHIGFLKTLEELNIEYDYLMGTSAGAIISAFAANDNVTAIANKGLSLKKEDYIDKISLPVLIYRLFKKAKKLGGFLKGEKLQKFLEKNLTNNDFSKTKRKLYIQAVNLSTAKSVIFKEGNIALAARASASLPLIYEPVQINGEWYTDGSITGVNAPEDLAELEHPDLIIIHSFLRKNPNEIFSIDTDWLPYQIVKKIVDAAFGEFEILRFEYLKKSNIPAIWIRPRSTIFLNLIDPIYEDFKKVIDDSHYQTLALLREELK